MFSFDFRYGCCILALAGFQVSYTPVEKSSICWLGLFWSIAAGLRWSLASHVLVLSWSRARASCLGLAHYQLRTSSWPAKDQLKTISNQQLCFKTNLTSICWAFQQGQDGMLCITLFSFIRSPSAEAKGIESSLSTSVGFYLCKYCNASRLPEVV